MKIFFTLLCLAIISWSFRHINTPAPATRPQHVNIQTLPGYWVSQDSSRHTIYFRFNDTLKEVELYTPGDNRPYYFLRAGIPNPDSLVGVRMNWPPYDCYLIQTDSTHISIRYQVMNHSSERIAYTKLAKN